MFEQETQDIKRRRRLADILQQQGMESPEGRMVSGHYVSPHFTQRLSQMLSMYGGHKQAEAAETMESELQKKKREALAGVLSGKPGEDFSSKASYFNQVQDLDPDLAGAIGPSLFRGANSDKSPSAVDEYKFFSQLPPDQQQAYLNVKRSGYSLEGQRFDPSNQVVVGSDITSKAAGQVAAAEAAGKESGKSQAQAISSFPQDEANALQTIELLDELSVHPGLSFAVGKSSLLPVIPGTEAANFKTRLEQLKGKQFLEAYSDLKGGGHITEIEGAKAEQAIARLDVAQTEQEFKTAIGELKGVIQSGLERKRARVGQQPLTQSPQAGGIKFLGFE